MPHELEIATVWLRHRLAAARRRLDDEAGASVIETVIIASGFAALALAVMAAITALVNGKVGGISL
jgi:hypothetical protein